MTPDLEKALKAHRSLRSPRVLYQLQEGAVVACTIDSLNGTMERIQRAAGRLEDGLIHKLRHTFASHLVMKGAPMRVVQELMGHASITTTMAYAHLTPDAKANAIELLGGTMVERAKKEKGAVGGALS